MSSMMKIDDNATVPGLVSDCRLMLRYALKDGFELSSDLLDQIAQLDSLLKQFAFAPISDVDERLVPGDTPQVAGQATGSLVPERAASADSTPSQIGAVGQILKVHAGLSKVIAPTTALTLQASEPPPGKHRFFGGMPLIVKAAASASLACALLFVGSAGIIEERAATGNTLPIVQKVNGPGASSISAPAAKPEDSQP